MGQPGHPGQQRRPARQCPPSGSRRGNRRWHLGGGELSGDVARGKEPQPLRHRGQADAVLPAPEPGAQGGQVRDEALVLAGRHHGVAGRDQVLADVAHQHREYRLVPAAGQFHRDHGVIDAAGYLAHDPGLPHPVGPVDVVAGDAHDPVRLRAEPLQEVGVPARGDPLVGGPGPGVGGLDPLA
jgi:hypothetical protein